MGDDFTLIPLPGLPSLTKVRLYDETWEEIPRKHSEFASIERSALETAIANPTTIHSSRTNPETGIVIVSESLTYSDHPVIVPIKQVEGTSGRVQTAYFSPNYSGTILWSAGNV